VLGAVLFVVGLRARRTRLWLGLSALSLSLGSAFLFGLSAGEPAVHPLLALVVSVLTVAFFGWSIQRAVIAQRERPRHDPSSILGLVGEVRTTLDPTGSVYVGGELWSARSDAVLPVGTSVRVTAREGLLLLVEPVRHDAVSRSTQGGS
jgi:membrane-bound serine protease (ClpP class)